MQEWNENMKKNQKLFIFCGEAFSGKSTLAKKLSEKYKAKLIGRDEIYFSIEQQLALEETPEEDDDFLWKNFWPIVIQGTKNQLLLGNSVVIDDNCFLVSQRKDLYKITQELGVDSILIYLDIPQEILKERKEKNKIEKTRHDVPSAWVESDALKFERPTQDENPIVVKHTDSFENLIKILEEGRE